MFHISQQFSYYPTLCWGIFGMFLFLFRTTNIWFFQQFLYRRIYIAMNANNVSHAENKFKEKEEIFCYQIKEIVGMWVQWWSFFFLLKNVTINCCKTWKTSENLSSYVMWPKFISIFRMEVKLKRNFIVMQTKLRVGKKGGMLDAVILWWINRSIKETFILWLRW